MKYKKRYATPSEPVTWKRIGVKERRCRGCDRKLTLIEVAHFGTDTEGTRFVECARCFEANAIKAFLIENNDLQGSEEDVG